MLVTLQGFGSIWERRSGALSASSGNLARRPYYNTTGVIANGKVRYRWRIGGKIRFNPSRGLNPNYPTRALSRVFECEQAERRPGGWNQILFKRMLSRAARPDLYLFVVTAEQTGHINVGSASWKAQDVQVVSFSEDRDQQEVMLLMPAYSWINGELGTFYVEPSARQFWSAELRIARPR